MLSKEELAQFLYDNFYDEKSNFIDISSLDFRRYDCNINISGMKTNKSIYQNKQEAYAIHQNKCQAVTIDQSECQAVTIEQNNQKAENIHQQFQEADEISQNNCTAQKIYQYHQNADEVFIDDIDFFDVEDKEDYLILRPRVVKLTKKEIEKKLGYRINIIEED